VDADQFYDQNARIVPSEKHTIAINSIYAAYGLSDRLTIAGYIPFQGSHQVANGPSLSSFGDMNLDLHYAVTTSGLRLSVGVLAGLPTGKTERVEGVLLQTGDGEFNQLFHADLGTGFMLGSVPSYFAAQLAWNNRSENFSDEVHLGLKLGASFVNQKLQTALSIQSVNPRDPVVGGPVPNPLSIFSNQLRYNAVTIEVGYVLYKNIGVNVAYGTLIGSAENILARPTLSFGVFGKF